MHDRVDEVLEFWFGTAPIPTQAVIARWFTKDPAFDAEIRRRFGDLLDNADALAAWRDDARAELAAIIVLDQFSRNAFRDDPRAFAHDPLALAIARELRASERDRALTYHQRWFALMPFEHAEDTGAQADSVAAFEQLRDEAQAAGAPSDVTGGLSSALDYAKKHAVVVERFGRFPHRNRILGRASTPEEAEFLTQPGSSF